MSKTIHYVSLVAGLILFSLTAGLSPARAQQASDQEHRLQDIRSGVTVKDFTVNLRWYSFFSFLDEEMKSMTELNFQFRDVYLISSHWGLGYKAHANVYVAGFFKGAGVGGGGLGPLVRYYPLESNRWEPYLQAGGLAGYDLALADALGANRYEGIRFRTSLRGGLSYRVSNAFGIFVELGPTWEYETSFILDARALQIDVGISLFRF